MNLSCFESLNDVFKTSNQSIALQIGRKYLDRPIFRLKLWKKIPELQKYQQLCGRTSADFGKMCINFLEQSSLNCNKNAIFLFSYLKLSIIRKRIRFCLKVMFFVMFGSCPHFLNKVLDKVYSKQLRSYDPTN